MIRNLTVDSNFIKFDFSGRFNMCSAKVKVCRNDTDKFGKEKMLVTDYEVLGKPHDPSDILQNELIKPLKDDLENVALNNKWIIWDL